jgi:hypothetical protein
VSPGICECGHTRLRHSKDHPNACAVRKCQCVSFGDQPDTPVRRSFTNMQDAYAYAAGAAAIQGKRWLVCKRVGKWYAIEPGLANTVRSNPNWPGRPHARTDA